MVGLSLAGAVAFDADYVDIVRLRRIDLDLHRHAEARRRFDAAGGVVNLAIVLFLAIALRLYPFVAWNVPSSATR